MRIRAPKDFWSGVMFAGLAAGAYLTARSYPLGTSTKMGPGYFPIVLSFVLAALGLFLIARSLVVSGEALEEFRLRPLAVLVVAIAAFAALLGKLGLVVSLALVTAFSAAAGSEFKWLEAIALSVGITLLSVLVFVVALRLPLPLWPSL